MIKPQQNSSHQTINSDLILYDYLKDYLIEHTAEETILEFCSLFTEGRTQDILVRNTIENIICSKIEKEQFCAILNCCFYILINYWLQNKEDLHYITKLIESFDNIEEKTKSCNRRKLKLLSLTKTFVGSKDYATLERIAIITKAVSSLKIDNQLLIQSLLSRYTYLYQPFIIEQESLDRVSQVVQSLQIVRTKDFELKLSQHIIYRSRLIEIAKAQQFSSGAGKIIRRIANPTLLSDRDLKIILKQNIKKIDNKATLSQLSRDFTIKVNRNISYREFKQFLYHYLIYQIKPRNLQLDFKGKLWEVIDRAYYQSDSSPLNESLILRTCRKLYQELIINFADKDRHKLLTRLIANLGTAQTVILLLKIVIICPQAKPDLEQRLASLFAYYELKTIENHPWIVKFLEYFLVTFAIHFGEIDLSLAKII